MIQHEVKVALPENELLGILPNGREKWRLVGGEILTNVHRSGNCQSPPCSIHSPSRHHMRTWPLHMDHTSGFMERLCEHGLPHLDPDSAAQFPDAVHLCDGCCDQDNAVVRV